MPLNEIFEDALEQAENLNHRLKMPNMLDSQADILDHCTSAIREITEVIRDTVPLLPVRSQDRKETDDIVTLSLYELEDFVISVSGKHGVRREEAAVLKPLAEACFHILSACNKALAR